MAREREESTGVAGVSLRIVHNLPFSKSVDDAAGLKPGRVHTAERAIPIYLWSGPRVGTTGQPWKLDVEAGMSGKDEVDVEGKQRGNCDNG